MNNNKTLIIVESPSKARKIQQYLGDQFICRSSYGHISDLFSGGKYNNGIDIDNDFAIKYKLLPDKKDKIQAIIDASVECNKIYIASDPDREGEIIAYNISQILENTEKPIFRVLFHEITKTGIKIGLNNPGQIDMNMCASQQGRRAIDRITGFSASPLLADIFKQNLSAGRTQSAALKLLTDREKEINMFKPEEYFNISAQLSSQNSIKESFTAKYSNKISNKDLAEKIKNELSSDTFIISEIEEKEKKRNPLPPLTTLPLTYLAAAKYKFSAAKTMTIAQSLYEQGIISYHRSDSIRLGEDSIIAAREWLEKNNHQIPKEANLYLNKDAAQDAHTAICPTSVLKLPTNLYASDDEQKIYKLIWERLIASQAAPAIFATTNVIIKSSSDHLLKANGKILKSKGWLEITEDIDDDTNDIKLPILIKNSNLLLVPPKVKAEKRSTIAPSRYSEKTLIKELERKGIGRPSTIANICGTITNRNYVVAKGGLFIPTELGIKVSDLLSKYFDFVKSDYTAKMEQQLDLIATGKLTYLQMMKDFYYPFVEQLKNAYKENITDYGYNCEKCSEKMELRHGIFGYYMSCLNYKTGCKTSFSCDFIDGKVAPKENKQEIVPDLFCPKCNGEMFLKAGKFGKYYACFVPSCHGSRKFLIGKKCPQCSEELYETVYEGKQIIFCTGYYQGCKYREDLNTIDPKTLLEPSYQERLSKSIKLKK